MKSRTGNLNLVVLALVAGTATCALAQNSSNGRTSTEHIAQTSASSPDFRSSHWLIGRNIVNSNGDTIAEVNDLILDRGSGRVEYGVIKAGSVLGIGGKTIAIPYSTLRWDNAKERFILDSTTEQLKQFPEFTAESWSSMMESKKGHKNSLLDRLSEGDRWKSDPYTGKLDASNASKVSGEITKVDRVRTTDFGEQVIVTIKAEDGSTRRVALGPSWFVSGGSVAPMRGDKVTVETLVVPQDPDQTLVGTRMTREEQQRMLRNPQGEPGWAAQTQDIDGKSYNTPYWRHVLLSNLRGMKIDCRGNECGKVHDVIFDRESGEVAFLSIDPNQNFLGIGDTKRLVPWSVATVALDGSVRLDASKEMILASAETPKDIKDLSGHTSADSVYKAYDVPRPAFEKPRGVAAKLPGHDAWAASGPVFGAIDRASDKTMRGEITDITEVKFEGNVPPAKAIKLKADGDEHLILVGPTWYMNNEKLAYGEGDSVAVDVCRTTVGGKTYWMARSISGNGAKVVLIDGGEPVWDQR